MTPRPIVEIIMKMAQVRLPLWKDEHVYQRH
jgi:hypothetical protein